MDSLTHLAVGTMIGAAVSLPKPRRAALVLGMISHSIPDIDMVASWWLPLSKDLLAHRGITHSLFGGLLMTLVIGWICQRIRYFNDLSRKEQYLIIGSGVFMHLFLDSFNNYGTGWFEPFSSIRISFNSIYVIDPFLSIPVIIAAIIVWARNGASGVVKKVGTIGWIWLGSYLLYSVYHKIEIDRFLLEAKKDIPSKDYFTTPAPFQNWMWMLTYRERDSIFVGYHSLRSEAEFQFKGYPIGNELKEAVNDLAALADLVQFSQGFYILEKKEDEYYFNDVRFGQSFGWEDPPGRFVLRYSFDHNELNKTIIQKGRMEGWDRKRWNYYWKKVWGE